MCESKVYLRDKGSDEKIADEALTVVEDGDSVVVVGLFGDKVRVDNAEIVEVDARKHVVYLKRVSNDEGTQA